MEPGDEWRESDTFVIRVFRAPDAGLMGVVQHVRTGERASFQDLTTLGATLASMRRSAAGTTG
jgi:hypothetical protein